MIDKRILYYFRNYSDKYPLEALKKKALASGYTEEDVEEALRSAKGQVLDFNFDAKGIRVKKI